MRRVQLLLLAISVWAVLYARYSLGPLQESMQRNLQLSDNQIALLVGVAFALPMALAAIPAGLAHDRFRRPPLFLALSILTLSAILLTSFASTMTMLVIARGMAGIAMAATFVCAYAMLGDLYPPHQRGRALMFVGIGELLGAPSAFALGGVLLVTATAYAHSSFAAWRWVQLWMAAPLLLVVLAMLAMREPSRLTEHGKPPIRLVWSRLWALRRVILPLIFARMLVWIADGGVEVWAAPSFSRHFDLPPDQVADIIATVLLIGGVLGPLVGGPLHDWCERTGGARRTMVMMGFLAVLCIPLGLFNLMPTPFAAACLLTAFMGVSFVINVLAMTLTTIIVPSDIRGVFVAISVTGASIFAFGLAPVVVSLLSGLLGGPQNIALSLGLVCAGTSLIGAIIFFFGRTRFSGREIHSASSAGQ